MTCVEHFNKFNCYLILVLQVILYNYIHYIKQSYWLATSKRLHELYKQYHLVVVHLVVGHMPFSY